MASKDRDNIIQKSRAIYRHKCDRLECEEEYIGESERTFEERLKGTYHSTLPIYDHASTSGHHTKQDNFSIVGSKSCITTRTIKEAMFIRVNDPFLNRNIGQYWLPLIWDEVLCNILDLYLKETLLPAQQGLL